MSVVLELFIGPNYIDHQGLEGEELLGPTGFAQVVTIARLFHPDFRVIIDHISEDSNTVTAQLTWFEPTESSDTGSEADPVNQRVTKETIRLANGFEVEHWGEKIAIG